MSKIEYPSRLCCEYRDNFRRVFVSTLREESGGAAFDAASADRGAGDLLTVRVRICAADSGGGDPGTGNLARRERAVRHGFAAIS